MTTSKPPPSFIVRDGVTGIQRGKTYISQVHAERAARRRSHSTPQSLEIWWVNSIGVPKIKLGYAYKGEVTRTIMGENPSTSRTFGMSFELGASS